MKTILKIAFLFFVAVFIISCDKTKPDDVDRPLVFTSLTAANDTISPGGSTTVTAIADGDGIQYFWSASAGDILGSGATITYVSPPCVIGNNQVNCTVRDKANNALSKSITITVL